ncbi:porin family protein [Rhodocaloribacter sp.]
MKNLLLLTLLTALALPARAQPIRFGVEAGFSRADVPRDHLPERGDSRGGASINVMAFALAPLGATKFTLQTGLRFLSYRNEETVRIANGLFDRFRLTQYHLVLPLRLRYTLFRNVFVMAGPEVGFLLRATSESEIYDVLTIRRSNLTGSTNRFHLALKAGAGYAFRVGGRRLYVQALYGRSLTGIGRHPEAEDLNRHVEEAGFSVGYLF